MEADGQLFEDLFWTYKTALPESVKIAGLVSLWSERVDLYVDGVLTTHRAAPEMRGDNRGTSLSALLGLHF